MSYSTAFSQAIIVSIYIADKVNNGMYEFVPTSAICTSLNLKAPTLVKIISSLSKADLLETKEGKNGGVRFKKRYDQIDFLDIFEAIESNKPLFSIHSELGSHGRKPDIAKVIMNKALISAEKSMKQELKQYKLSNILENMK